MNNTKRNAEEAYVDAHARANHLLDQLRTRISDLPAPESGTPIHWGHVGDLNHINELLEQADAFLRGEE